MKCPACPTTSLVIAERSGIEIDYCPDCRGVWLDRGELDKIIERAAPTAAPTAAAVPAFAPPAAPLPSPLDRPSGRLRRDHDDDDDDDYDDDDRRRGGYDRDGLGKRRKRKGFLGDLFDF